MHIKFLYNKNIKLKFMDLLRIFIKEILKKITKHKKYYILLLYKTIYNKIS